MQDQSSSDLSQGVSKVPPRSGRSAARPIGITLLVILHVLVVCGLIVVLPMLWRELEGVERAPLFAAILVIQLSLHFLIGVAILLGIINLVCGIGLWFRTRWGWWLEGSLSASNIYLYAFDIVTFLFPNNPWDADGAPSNDNLLTRLPTIAFCALIIGYLMRGNVLAYFRLTGLGKAKALGLMAIGGVVLLLVTTVAFMLAAKAAVWLL